jgi:hypothetical protein
VGSASKLDVVALSPHVTLAERLEGLTKAYGVPILLSGAAYALLSPQVRQLCRLVDVVRVGGGGGGGGGSGVTVPLYTFDVCDEDVLALIQRYVRHHHA